jgi:hypothetical protein
MDFRKAFDSVDRIALWQKLLKNNISGNFLNILHNMYDKTKSCVKAGNKISFFASNAGV